MVYYAVIYMNDGNIHLFKSDTKEGAEDCIKGLQDSKWKDQIETTKIVKKDTTTALWQNTNGHWIGV